MSRTVQVTDLSPWKGLMKDFGQGSVVDFPLWAPMLEVLQLMYLWVHACTRQSLHCVVDGHQRQSGAVLHLPTCEDVAMILT